jgi:plastocyanin
MECETPDDCTVTGTACMEKACNEGMCGLDMLPAGTEVPDEDVPGDCQVAVCDAQGNVAGETDDTDVPDDGEDCTVDGCMQGNPTSLSAPAGAPCMTGGGTVCDGAGSCVECNDTPDCSGGEVCVDNQCVPPSCMDAVLNGDETDTDCGGPVCAGCMNGLMCVIDDDCSSGFCDPTNDLCAEPSCMDNFWNGAETDVDCGGPTCPACPDGDACAQDNDCTSGFCNLATLVCAQPSCSDGVSNGDETGVDCGGPTCGDCSNGQACTVDGDCTSGACVQSVCGAINGCELGTATDFTAQSAVNVTFGGTAYTPKCIRVSQGTQVTFSGTFGSHPLMGGYVQGGVNPAASGPFVPVTNTGSMKTVTMTQTGTFPYYCTVHALAGMTGAVFVVP